jgi:hypothetical protein
MSVDLPAVKDLATSHQLPAISKINPGAPPSTARVISNADEKG